MESYSSGGNSAGTAAIILKSISLFKLLIINGSFSCSLITHVTDADSSQITAVELTEHDNFSDATHLVLPPLSGPASQPEFLYRAKFTSPCALTVIGIESIGGLNSKGSGTNASAIAPPAIFGSSRREFHLFFPSNNCDSNKNSKRLFLKVARQLFRAYFLSFCDKSLKVFTITPNGRSIIKIASSDVDTGSLLWSAGPGS